MKPTLGMRVYADKVYEWPDKSTWEDGETVELSPIDNPLKDEVAVIVGRERKKYRSELQYYYSDDVFGNSNEGWFHNDVPWKKAFIVIRYRLSGRRYYTTPEYLREAE